MNFNFIYNKNFIKIAIGLIVVIAIALIGFNFGTVVEGLTTSNPPYYTQCTELNNTSCSSCINAGIVDVGYGVCYWNGSTKKCSAFDGDGYSKNCNDPTPGPSDTCPAKNNRFGCLLEDGCAWDNGKCRIDNQPDFDKCAGNDHCIPCTMSGCYFSKMGGCAKTKLDASYSRMCKDIIAPSQEKCQIHNNCKMCVQDGCLWGGTAGYTPNCISPDTEHNEADYSNKYCALRDESTTTNTTDTTESTTGTQ